jgi:hypothetical protein
MEILKYTFTKNLNTNYSKNIMFNKQILWYGLTGYAIGVGCCVMIESLTKNKWEKHYSKYEDLFCTRLKPRLIDYLISIPPIIGASTGMYIGYRLQ